MRIAPSVGLMAALLLSFSVTAVVAMQDSSDGVRDKRDPGLARQRQELDSPHPQQLLEDPNVKFVGVTPSGLPKEPLMIDVALASIEVGPQGERCGTHSVGKEALKAVVRQYIATNKAFIRTQQVGEGDPLTVMACVYPNHLYPGQAVLSVAVPQRFSEPFIIPVSDDCVKRVNEAVAIGGPIPADCKPTAPPVELETLLIAVPLKELAY